MRRASIVFSLVVAMSAANAAVVEPPAAADPLRSAECRKALDALQTHEATAGRAAPGADGPAADRRPAAPSPALASARRQAAVACLASRADPPPQPQRLAQPPVVVAPLTAVRPMQAPSPSSRQAPAPALGSPAEPPHFVLSCDAAGCWANDGSRLNRVGPNLWGSRGACALQGTLLQCP
jgi:hypothetical protein